MPCHPVLERASSAAWTEPAAASKNWCSTPGCQSLVNVRRRASAEKGRCWESLHAQVEKKSHATISEYISFQTHYSHVCNCMQPVMLNFQTEYLVSHSYRGMGMYLFWQNKIHLLQEHISQQVFATRHSLFPSLQLQNSFWEIFLHVRK